MSNVTMREMLEAGVHFGHQARYWNPKMAPYLFGQRNKIHIINLEQTLPLYDEAVNFVSQLAARKGTILFAGTKRAAQSIVQEEANRCGMPYVNRRWLGGLLTNFKTVKQSINRLKKLESMAEDGSLERMSKKELLHHRREQEKLERSVSGIKNMPGIPDALFVIDVGYERIAVSEANKLGIPIIGVVDSNNSPECIDYVIPGNDDAIRSIRLYARGVADAILASRQATAHIGSDVGGDDFVELDDSGAPIVPVAVEKLSQSKVTVKQKTKKKKIGLVPKVVKDDQAGQDEPDYLVPTVGEAIDDLKKEAEKASVEDTTIKKTKKKAVTKKKVTKKKVTKKKATKKKAAKKTAARKDEE